MKWLQWQPPIFSDPPEPEPTKPSKPGSVGFEGSETNESQKIAGGSVGFEGPNLGRSQKIDALSTVKASGVRMATHENQRVIAVPAVHDTAQLREALEVLGFACCGVFHLDTAPFRSKSSNSIAEAIENRS